MKALLLATAVGLASLFLTGSAEAQRGGGGRGGGGVRVGGGGGARVGGGSVGAVRVGGANFGGVRAGNYSGIAAINTGNVAAIRAYNNNNGGYYYGGYGRGYYGLGGFGLGYAVGRLGGYGYGGYGGGPGGYYYGNTVASDYAYAVPADGNVPPQDGAAGQLLPPVNPTDNTAAIQAILPDPNAVVLLDGKPTTSVGRERVYTSPALEPGYKYSYTLTATWTAPNGTTMRDERVIPVAPNRVSLADFTRPAPPETAAPPAQSDAAK